MESLTAYLCIGMTTIYVGFYMKRGCARDSEQSKQGHFFAFELSACDISCMPVFPIVCEHSLPWNVSRIHRHSRGSLAAWARWELTKGIGIGPAVCAIGSHDYQT